MYKSCGPQGWWPLTPRGSYKSKHHQGRPKTDKNRFEIILGAILTQNTNWKNVEKSIEVLNKNKLINPEGIIAIPKSKLGEVIRSSGYYNQKSKTLKIVAKFFRLTKLSQLSKLKTEDLRSILLKIKGIGPETADSIILYAFEQPIFVVDAYTKRIFSRYGLIGENAKYDEVQAFFHKHLRKSLTTYKEYHALIVEHAKRYCKVKPKCEECILKRTCKYGKKASKQ